MGVLKKNSADPFRDWKQKHVVAECGRPIGHSETDAFARDHPAATNQEESRKRGEPSEAIQPFAVAGLCERRTWSDSSLHSLKINLAVETMRRS